MHVKATTPSPFVRESLWVSTQNNTCSCVRTTGDGAIPSSRGPRSWRHCSHGMYSTSYCLSGPVIPIFLYLPYAGMVYFPRLMLLLPSSLLLLLLLSLSQPALVSLALLRKPSPLVSLSESRSKGNSTGTCKPHAMR